MTGDMVALLRPDDPDVRLVEYGEWWEDGWYASWVVDPPGTRCCTGPYPTAEAAENAARQWAPRLAAPVSWQQRGGAWCPYTTAVGSHPMECSHPTEEEADR